jgi:hypothetical protein
LDFCHQNSTAVLYRYDVYASFNLNEGHIYEIHDDAVGSDAGGRMRGHQPVHGTHRA